MVSRVPAAEDGLSSKGLPVTNYHPNLQSIYSFSDKISTLHTVLKGLLEQRGQLERHFQSTYSPCATFMQHSC